MALWSKKPPSEQPPAASPPPASANSGPAKVAPAGATNSKSAPAPDLSAEELAKRRALSRHVSATFGEIVSVLMRQPSSKRHSLSDLEWMVLPALMANQFSLAEAQSKAQGFTVPIALLLWARVSPEVDKRLAAALDQPLRLAPAEWTSGDNVWLVEACGEPRALQAMIRKTAEEKWKGRTVKFRSKGSDGKTVVRVLGAAAAGDHVA